VGAINAAIAVLATARQRVPPTLNAERVPGDVAIRLTRELTEGPFETVLCLSHTAQGQAVAVVLGRP
jgi:3-oxoacyl-(acyl-carrier-protein) synthase